VVALLQDVLRRQGEWLFRHRGWLPLVLLPVVFFGVLSGEIPAVARSVGWQVFCSSLVVLGALLRAWVVGTVPEGTSGRATRQQVAEELNTRGAYSLLRHPLYATNALMWAGVLLRPGLWWLFLVGMAFFVLVYERIALAEEAFLSGRFPQVFLQWGERTPAFLPRFRGYEAPGLPFRWRQVLRREYSTWVAAVASLAVVEALLQWRWTGAFRLSPGWWIALAAAVAVAVMLRFLKYRTRCLSERNAGYDRASMHGDFPMGQGTP
jgi:protein-S-isoprenylcysteine O-methyltransferase Ste14